MRSLLATCSAKDNRRNVELVSPYSKPAKSPETDLEQLRAIFESNEDYQGLLDAKGTVLAANRASLSFVSATLDQVVGKPFWDTIWFADTEGARDMVREAVHLAAAGYTVRREVSLRSQDGRTADVELSFQPVRDEHGDIIYIVPKGRNITEWKAAELRNAFLLRLDDSLRPLEDVGQIARTFARMLADHLRADRSSYSEMEKDSDNLIVQGGYTTEAVKLPDRYRLSDLGPDFASAMKKNTPFAVQDRPKEDRVAPAFATLRSICAVPLHKNGRLLAVITVSRQSPSPWSASDIELLESVAPRVGEAVERAKITHELQASERRLRLAQKAGRTGTFEWLIQGDRITWTPELESLYGLAPGTFEGRFEDWRKRVVPEDAQQVVNGIEQALADRAAEHSYEFRAVLPDGKRRWLAGHAQFLYRDDGEPERMIGINADIDGWKSAELALRQQWQSFDTVVSNNPDFAYTFDLEGRFTYANRSLLSLLQLTLEQVVGKNFYELNYPADLAERLHRQIQHVVDTKASIRDEMAFTGPSGETRQYEHIFVPVLSANQTVDAVAGSTRDITERKQKEEQEREREEQLRETARLESLGVMAGGVAHDFNNLLTGILGNACILAENPQEEVSSFGRQIVMAAERAADLTQQMLAFSGKGRFAVESVDLNKLIKDNRTLLRASLSRTVTIELDLSQQDCYVEADRAQLQQVVMNLLINASEAIADRPGVVKIRTAISERMVKLFSPFLQTSVPAGKYVLLEVADNGCGMTPETLKKIFDPFFTTKFTGRGLGLAAVLGIIKGHGGDVEVITRESRGTTFRILLPLAEKVEKPSGVAPAKPVQENWEHAVLVVDDEEVVRKVAATALSRKGFRVVLATNGEDALQKLREDEKIALIVLDLTMPVMTGEQAIPLIKQVRADVPILLSSGFNEAEIALRFASAGIAGVLQKPYKVAEITGKVAELLRAVRP